MRNSIILPFLMVCVFGLSHLNASAQCKAFTKKNCMNALSGYTGNGQYNGAVMFEGEMATLVQTFYSGKDYRLFVCAHSAISDSIYYEVIDYRKNLLFSSKETGNQTFDFTVATTQQLYVRIFVPNLGTANELKKNGCVSVMVGFKEN